MNIYDQLLQNNLYKYLDHQLLQQIQNQNQAANDLLYKLTKNRQNQNKKQKIINKIHQLKNFINLLNQLFQIFKSQNNHQKVLNFILQNQSINQNTLLLEMIKAQSQTLQKQIYQIIKKTFIFKQKSDTFQHYIQDIQFSNQYLQVLNQTLSQIQSTNSIPQRPTLLNADQMDQQFQLIFQRFKRKTQIFNYQILTLIQRIIIFQQKIRQKFINVINFQSQQLTNEKQQNIINLSNEVQNKQHLNSIENSIKQIKNLQINVNQFNNNDKNKISESQVTFNNRNYSLRQSPQNISLKSQLQTPRKILYTNQNDAQQMAINAIINSKRARKIYDRNSASLSQIQLQMEASKNSCNQIYNQTFDRVYRNNLDLYGIKTIGGYSQSTKYTLGNKSQYLNENQKRNILRKYEKNNIYKNYPLTLLKVTPL